MIVKIVAQNWVKPEKKEEFLPLVKELVAKSAAEDGNIEYRLFENREDPTHLVLVEEWESWEKLEVHRTTEHFTRILPQLGEYLAKPGITTRMNPL